MTDEACVRRAIPRAKVDSRLIDYSGYARRYDQARFAGRTNAYQERIRLNALDRAASGLDRRARILDVGCGTGRGLASLQRLGFTRLTGLDYTHDMLVQSRAKLTPMRGVAASLSRGSAFALPFAARTFDLVTSFNFVHMFRLDLQQEIVEEARRVCAPGGHLIIEFESIHKGLFFNRYLEQRRFKERTKFNSRWEMSRVFPRSLFDRIVVTGSVFPKLYVGLRFWPELGDLVESLAFYPPFNWLAARVIVRARVR